jgi:CTP synthase
LALEQRQPDLRSWQSLVDGLTSSSRPLKIAMVGKYVSLNDAYLSVVEALRHAAIAHQAALDMRWVNSEDVEAHGAEKYLAE